MSDPTSIRDDLSEAKEQYQFQSLEPTPAEDDDLGAGPQQAPPPLDPDDDTIAAGEFVHFVLPTMLFVETQNVCTHDILPVAS